MTVTIAIATDPPGLRGLNRLALHLNDLVAKHTITEWQLDRWEDARRIRQRIIFDTQSDADAAGRQTVPPKE